ncbi:allophanate hydrolase [Amycolatopsis orientalis]|uniref:Allophanate hydrolase n=1 Tax=Amycolatopsis orientalis TaxID=31958 RepID=A0A193BQQ5_AMYOR|nr:biotin-dependent carboxyltransferase family protein [Amycolatopsis orientalis]ANN14519.1 allophanate hydrolase [Amycolatopsis orientalis]
MRAVEVVDPGPLALVQDLGRPGYAHLGVPPSGALDVPALRLANRLVGNDEAAAGVECLFGGLRLRAKTSCTIAVTGPPATVRVDDRDVGSHAPVWLAAGQVASIGAPATGLRSYLAVSGGIAVDAELGSRSRDVLSEIGPAPLRAGDVLPLGPPSVSGGADVVLPTVAPAELVVRVDPGPRAHWFTGLAAGLAKTWTVTAESNRVGLRLDGPALTRGDEYAERELPSEGLLTGAVQVPPSGLPVVFLADHPTTGGYPVAAVVRQASLPSLAQARPGTLLRFHSSTRMWNR